MSVNQQLPQPCFFWLDLEMTGLDPATDRILEAGVVITRKDDFSVLEEWDTTVYQPREVLEGMNDWCKKHHGESGLTERVPHGIGEVELDARLEACAEKHFGEAAVILCGNSIGQDRKFVERYLPRFAGRLHYRMIDVSSFKTVFAECYGQKFAKRQTHRALDDIRESIAELRHYLSFVHVEG